MNQPVREVLKRNGRREVFDPGRLARSIQRAAQTAGQSSDLLSEELAALVALILEQDFPGKTPTTEDVRRLVEQILMETGHAAVARTFIVHGHRRKQLRVLHDTRQVRDGGPGTPLLVTSTSRECQEPWDRSRIVSQLVLEAGVAAEAAQRIAQSVEERVVGLGLPSVSASLVKDLLELELLEEGLEGASQLERRVGLSRRRIDSLLFDRDQHGPLEDRIGRNVLRRYSLGALLDRPLAEAHLRGRIQVDGLETPRRALAAVVGFEDLRRAGKLDEIPRALVQVLRCADECLDGPLYLVHVERLLALPEASREQRRAAVRALLLALCRQGAGHPSAQPVLVCSVDLPDATLARVFRRGQEPEALRKRCIEGVVDIAQGISELQPGLPVPRLRLLLPARDLTLLPAALRPVLERLGSYGGVELAVPVQPPAAFRILGSRVGINLARLALRSGRQGSERLLEQVRGETDCAVSAGARRLRSLMDLDEAGLGPRRLLRGRLETLSRELGFELPGEHGYQCAVIPVGLSAAIRAITERDPVECDRALELRGEILETMRSVLPTSAGGGASFYLSVEPFAPAERRLGRLDFAAYPRGRDILGLRHDGGAYQYRDQTSRDDLACLQESGLEPVWTDHS